MSQATVLTYDTAWPANVMSWSNDDSVFRIGIGSYIKRYSNQLDVVERDPESEQLVCRATAEHSYPPTKMLFAPPSYKGSNDKFITTGDYLRVWSMEPKAPEAETAAQEETPREAPAGDAPASRRKITHSLSFKTLNNNKNSEFCSPLTSCDWNSIDPSIVGACSIDTTVSIWDLEKETHTTQLIAHDKEVFDIAFARNTTVFSTCGADGSLRVFDTREMEHCTIVFESPELKPLLRCSWNKQDGTYIATFTVDGQQVFIIDIRYPSIPVGTLTAHTAPVNSMMWAPNSGTHICTAGEDKTALIWDLQELPNSQPSVLYNYAGAPAEINTIGWSVPRGANEDWVAITCANQLQVLKI